MNVMLADIETNVLDSAVSNLQVLGSSVGGVVCDVADPVSVDRAAQATIQAFGNVHVVCNNAGVAAGGWTDLISLDDWRWVLDVNLMGVVHGIRAFLPHIRGHGEGGHIVNTASMAGLVAGIGLSPYVASKFAVVGISEGLAMRLGSDNIGVTVVCPGFVRTHIGESGRNRQQRYGQAPVLEPSSPKAAVMAEIRRLIEAGIDPEKVAARVLFRGSRERTLRIHPP
jgi:NAD(P)-dependent dehydrogenase (short-subunit alcohol dehydrogenase family)